MSNSADLSQIPSTSQQPPRHPGDSNPVVAGDPRVSLLKLSNVRARMDVLQRFLSESVNNNTLIGKDQMDMVSSEISYAIHQIFINGAALLACTAAPPNTSSNANPSSIKVAETDLKFSESSNDYEVNSVSSSKEKFAVDRRIEEEEKVVVDMKIEEEEMKDEVLTDDCEIIELDSVELLAEHIHFCDICGKGFKRDANLRMHMRAHGNQYKTPEALAKPERITPELSMRKTRFSCPFVGCNRNKLHDKFRPLKSAICVKNHFKRSHCPKMYSCNRCNKKSFSVVADLKSHLKHCGESKWKCSCGTTFSRKDKLFGHMALFEGHMPAVVEEDDKARARGAAASAAAAEDDDEGEDLMEEEQEGAVRGANCAANDGFFDGLLEGFGSIDGYCLQDVLESPNALGSSVNQFFNF